MTTATGDSTTQHVEQPSPVVIGLALESGIKPRTAVRQDDHSPRSLAIMLVASGLLIVLSWAYPNVFSFWTGWVLVGVAWTVLIVCALVGRQRRMHRPADRHAAGTSAISPVWSRPSDAHRVWVAGSEWDQHQVQPGTIDPHQVFEPVIVPVWVRPHGRSPSTMFFLLFVIVLGVASLGSKIAPAVQGWLYLAFVLGIPAAGLATAWLFRRYTRITPGQVEVLSFGFLGIGREPIQRVDLRNARVIADLTQSCVFVIQPDGTNATIELVDSDRRHEIARAILHAAVCKARVPQLPDDQLLA